jgi:hypothetical protein
MVNVSASPPPAPVRHPLIPLALAAGLAACAQNADTDGPIQLGQIVGGATKQVAEVQPSGNSLPRPSLLKRGGADEPALTYVNPAAKFATYRKVMIDPVAIRPIPGSPLNKVYPDKKRELAKDFHSYLYRALSAHCQVVQTPSPGTLQINFELIDADVPDFVANTLATYTPYASLVYSGASFVFNKGVGYFSGSVTAEGYGTDAMDGTLLWEDVDKRAGTTAVVENTFDVWLDINHAFEAWAEKLAARLDKLGACKTPAK